MTGIFDPPDDAATPITPEEMRDLIPSHIASRDDLNLAEQNNILRGQEWALTRPRDILSEKFIKALHKHMFCDVWRWAGKFRLSERNIGVSFYEIPTTLDQLLQDSKTWVEYKSYKIDEIAIRFHHRLVQIHPFANGNGRHARLMADILAMNLGEERFSWGRTNLQSPSEVRRDYISALKSADNHDIRPLLKFARS